MLFAYIGSFAIRNSLSDVWIMTLFAILGYLMQRAGYPLAPLVLGAILGPLAERYFTTSMIASDNSLSIFVDRAVTTALLIIWVALLALLVWRATRHDNPKPPPTPTRASRQR